MSWRVPLLTIGWLLIVATPFVAVLPGPGGTLVLAGGVALLVRHSPWAKRCYVAIARRWPRIGRMLDWAMRRNRSTAESD